MSKTLLPGHISTSALLLIFLGIGLGAIGCVEADLPGFSQPQSNTESLSGGVETVISQEQLLGQISSDAAPLILDVRTIDEYQSGHVPGAINIPIQELSYRLEDLPDNKDISIVIYCERGVRSRRGYGYLQDAGFTHIQRLEGDMSAWRQQNRPISFPSLDQTDQMSGINKSQLSMVNGLDSSPDISFESQWIVSAEQAVQLVRRGATLLDAQGKGLGLRRFPGAKVVSWQQFSQTEHPHRGKLLAEDEQLTQRLQEVGISIDRPVVVFANPPNGWGEDGRIVWMLRTLGHGKVVMVDGGIKALLAFREEANDASAAAKVDRGDFVVKRRTNQTPEMAPDWDIQQDELQRLVNTPAQILLIDTRESREYAGETPYGEQRGGHVPGAIHLYFKDLLTEDGFLLPESELREKLRDYGLTIDKRAIAYCTGGIRSGWLTTVLVNYGYSVENYAGSMWEWSAAPADEYPLIQ
ncbi:MAG: rhodanese-like domain-containing protein [Cyanobacteria bacterium P01_F01_bin.150]